jgi:hypothetical protein
MIKSYVTFDPIMIAPCGINCGTCKAYLRERNSCCGCLVESGPKVNHCIICKIKNCEQHKMTGSKYCYDCEDFPCQLIRHIDKRYRTRYNTNLIQNLLSIKEIGIDKYLAEESEKWTCPTCGSVLSVHLSYCLKCNKKYL